MSVNWESDYERPRINWAFIASIVSGVVVWGSVGLCAWLIAYGWQPWKDVAYLVRSMCEFAPMLSLGILASLVAAAVCFILFVRSWRND